MRYILFIAFTLVFSIPSSAQNLKIICSTTQIADFLRNVGGDDIKVTCILAPGADPHTYQPTPQDAKMVLSSDMCFQNGLHLEGKNWMSTLAHDAHKPLITCTDGIKHLTIEYGGETVSDPHAWFSVTNVTVYVNNITGALVYYDSTNALRYTQRAKIYLNQLRALDNWLKSLFSDIPLAHRILITSHDAFNYFARDYGFENRAPVGWSTGSEVGGGVTPQKRISVINGIKQQGIKAIFIESTISPKIIQEIAREAGVKIGGKLYSDSMGESKSAGETYIGMMRENALIIYEALR